MTDHIPADKVREIVEKMYHHANHDNVRGTEEHRHRGPGRGHIVRRYVTTPEEA